MNKTCSDCKEIKHVSNFHKHKRNIDGFTAICKSCRQEYYRRNKGTIKLKHVAYSREYRQTNKGKTKDRNLINSFGINLSQFETMVEAQGNKCKICGNPETVKGRSLSVDHCHRTGKIRGLLCGKCNTGLGKFRDSDKILKKALDYLLQFSDNK